MCLTRLAFRRSHRIFLEGAPFDRVRWFYCKAVAEPATLAFRRESASLAVIAYGAMARGWNIAVGGDMTYTRPSRAERDDALFTSVRDALNMLAFERDYAVPARLRQARTILDGCRQSDADLAKLRRAAKLLRGCGIELMKAAANLESAAS